MFHSTKMGEKGGLTDQENRQQTISNTNRPQGEVIKINQANQIDHSKMLQMSFV